MNKSLMKVYDLMKRIDSSYNLTESVKLVMGDIGYHSGDLGKGRDTYMFHMQNRNTGHFGTGVYFVSKEEIARSNGFEDRPQHAVDFSYYKLFRPYNFKDAMALHDFLKDLNNYYNIDRNNLEGREAFDAKKDNFDELDWEIYSKNGANYTDADISREDFDSLKKIVEDILGRQILRKFSLNKEDNEFTVRKFREQVRNAEYDGFKEKIENFINFETRKIGYILRANQDVLIKIIDDIYTDTQNIDRKTSETHDSPSTILMKKLGYEGVDVRHIKEMDNQTYGSVIYDLKQESIIY